MQFDIPAGHLPNEFSSQPPHFHSSYIPTRAKPEIGSEHNDLSHLSDHPNNRFSSHNQQQQPLPAYSHSHSNFSYHSAPHPPSILTDFSPSNTSTDNLYGHSPLPIPDHSPQSHNSHYGSSQPSQSIPPAEPSHKIAPPKAFPCSTCGKCFARRSDLARHERIHSGIRPHVCTFENCGKQFIQRSALTVHYRVHTGEKPHMCERCGKSFSDSSSLARHRRIHSGKRPYKCPYADCQKTFTRRTTLTRHQAQHTGTVEEAAVATAAALASRVMMAKTRSDLDALYSHNGPSPLPSPTTHHQQQHHQSQISIPQQQSNTIPHIQTMHRHTPDVGYPSPIHTIPHLRTDCQSQSSPVGLSPLLPQSQTSYGRSPTSAISASMSVSGSAVMNAHRQSSLTSHPSTYSESILNNQTPTSSMHSSANSPHVGSSSGWHSPTHSSSGTPTALTTPTSIDGYVYSDHHYSVPYYSASHVRRSQPELDQYDTRQSAGIWAAPGVQ